jgi:hypothetical protein
MNVSSRLCLVLVDHDDVAPMERYYRGGLIDKIDCPNPVGSVGGVRLYGRKSSRLVGTSDGGTFECRSPPWRH